MKPRYQTHEPLPDGDTVFYHAFNIMADKVKDIAEDFRDTHGDEEMDPNTFNKEEKKQYDWICDTWANVRLNAMLIVKQAKEKGKQ